MTNHRRPPTRADLGFWWPITVRWGDMDAMGHVNNSLYLQYVESARVGYFEAFGWNSRDMGSDRQGPVVVSQTFNYRRQLFYPAEIDVGLRCDEVRNRSFILSFGVFRKAMDELIGDGQVVLVWLDYGLGRAVEIPPAVRKQLQEG